MPLYKKQPFPFKEKPNNLEPNERVFRVRFTNELFREYSEYLKRVNLYRRRVWTSKASMRTNLTYEEALVFEKKAAEKVKQFPNEFTAAVLLEVQFSMLPLRDLVNAIFEKLQGPLSKSNVSYAKKNNRAYPCKIVQVLEGDGKTGYEVLWLDKDKKVTGNSLIKGEDLIEKLPFSKEVLKSFIRESTYRYSPWVLHDNLAKLHGISSHPPEGLGVNLSISIQNGLVVCSSKRKKAEDESISRQNGLVVCSRKRKKAEDEKTSPCQSQTTTEVLEDMHAPDMLIKTMPTCKRGHEDANDNHVKVLEDFAQPKKLRTKAAEKSNDEQKGPLDDPIAKSLCQRRFVPKQTENLSALPYELLVEIAKRLKKIEDFTCYRSVSRSLNLNLKEEYFEGLPFRKSLPYLMLPPVSSSSRDGNVDIRRQFYSLVEGESIVASLEVPAFKTSTRFCFESLGWLLTIEVDGSMSLLDPFSDTEIPVPHLHTFPGLEMLTMDRRFLIKKMVLSSKPNETSDFILMVIIGDLSHLAFWRLGDISWNKIDSRKGVFRDVVYVGGERFYAIGSLGVLWVINLAAGLVECRIIIEHIPVLYANNLQGQYILKTMYGSLLGIRRNKDLTSYLTRDFEVYDIDIATGTWERIYSLGHMAVFLGCNSSFVVDATATVSNGGGVIKANHIYFTDDFMEYQHMYFTVSSWRTFSGLCPHAKGGSVDSGVLNFETGDIEPIYPVQPLTSNVCPAMWITPNICF